jgi:uncharacterized protein YbbC (DUF1343 family)
MGVRTGLDRWVDDGFRALRGRKVGLLAHPASVDRELRHVLDLMRAHGVHPKALFGPEHGIDGAAQDMEPVSGAGASEETRAGSAQLEEPAVHSLYGTTEESLRPSSDVFRDIDVLVVDMQDVGARYYTYFATLGYCMEVAAQVGIEVVVLDRPNPIGGRDEDVDGPSVQDGFRSFVSAYPLPVRHGLTLGEIAQWLRAHFVPDVPLDVVWMAGWRRDMAFDDTGLPWVLPSPNMPSLEAAWLYPGQCLFEGTDFSEGRGTTRPFELVGAPWQDPHDWARSAQSDAGPGVKLRPTRFKPMFQKHANVPCGGVQVHLTDRWACRPLQVTLALFRHAHRLGWRSEAYEFVTDRWAVDLLLGSTAVRDRLEAGASVPELLEVWSEDVRTFREARRPYLRYV